jgi:superfamily I DNA/RNA helicase
VRRAPWPPVVARADGEAALGPGVAELARRLHADVAGSVGIVCAAERLDALRAALAGVDYADATREALGAGINLLDLHVVKGLEFDAAVVVEPAEILDARPDGGRGGLYTALTRSTRALAIVHAAPLPAALAHGEHALAA